MKRVEASMRRYFLSLTTLLLLWGSSLVGVHAMSLDQITEQMAQSHIMREPHMEVEQRVELRAALVLRWTFTNQVTRNGNRIEMEVGRGAPSFMPDEMASDLIDIHDSLANFDLSLVETEEMDDGSVRYVIDGTRKPSLSSGAEGGRLWIQADPWVITRAELRYSWVRLEVDQWYRQENGRWVLDRQEALARPLGARLVVEYDDYWFGDA